MYEIPENLAHTKDMSKVVLESDRDNAFYLYLTKGLFIPLERAEKEGIVALFEEKEVKQFKPIESKAVTPDSNHKIENKAIKPTDTKKLPIKDATNTTDNSKA